MIKLIDVFYKPARGSAAYLWHDEPLLKLGPHAESSAGGGILINCDLVKRRGEADQEEDAAFASKVKKFIDAWDGGLAVHGGWCCSVFRT